MLNVSVYDGDACTSRRCQDIMSALSQVKEEPDGNVHSRNFHRFKDTHPDDFQQVSLMPIV